jgi:hypothetical protein
MTAEESVPAYCARSLPFCSLPVAVRGSAVTKSTDRGTL